MKVLNVYYHIKPGMTEKFIEELYSNDIPGICAAEDGCLGYDYFAPLEDEDGLLLVEKWESEEALAVHKTQPHFAFLQQLKDELVDTTDIKIFEA